MHNLTDTTSRSTCDFRQSVRVPQPIVVQWEVVIDNKASNENNFAQTEINVNTKSSNKYLDMFLHILFLLIDSKMKYN